MAAKRLSMRNTKEILRLKALGRSHRDIARALGSTVSGVPPTLELLRQISEHVPGPSNARIDVRELNIGEAAVTMKAETDSYEMAAQIEDSLRQEPRFKDAKKADEKKVGEALSFSLTIPLNAEAAAPAEGEAPGSEG